MTADTGVFVNEYSGEHSVRRSMREAANEHGFTLESYGLKDKATKRTLSMDLVGRGDDDEPPVLAAIRAALRQHGYEPGTRFRLTINATKEVGDQLRLNLGGDGHPDNV